MGKLEILLVGDSVEGDYKASVKSGLIADSDCQLLTKIVIGGGNPEISGITR
jgi:hypothetical protein